MITCTLQFSITIIIMPYNFYEKQRPYLELIKVILKTTDKKIN